MKTWIFALTLWIGATLSACGGSAGAEGETAEPQSGQAAPASRSAAEQPGAAASGTRTWSFDDLTAGAPPTGWRTEQTNPRGQGAQWAVQQNASAPSGGQVLALMDTRGATGSTYNLAWTDEVPFHNGRIEVQVRAGTGREDQGGGPIWRVQDRDNYYIARWNPLEDNFRLYYVREGQRDQLESANVDVSADGWHTIAIEHQGERIVGYLDGQQAFETTDDTFPQPGGVGVWTKADAATLFDDLAVTSQP